MTITLSDGRRAFSRWKCGFNGDSSGFEMILKAKTDVEVVLEGAEEAAAAFAALTTRTATDGCDDVTAFCSHAFQLKSKFDWQWRR